MKVKYKAIICVAVILVFLLVACLTGYTAQLDETGKTILSQEANSSEKYLASHWTSMMDEVVANTVDFSHLLEEANDDLAAVADQYCTGSGKNFTVSARVLIKDANTKSKAAYLVAELTNFKTDYVLHLQIGPIFKGTALRDSLSCIQFSDFDNQMDWSDLSSQIASKIEADVLARLDFENIIGQTITFTGCFTLGSDKILKIMPVSIVEE